MRVHNQFYSWLLGSFFFVRRYWWQWMLVMACGIAFLSLSPPESIPRVAGGDKLHHALVYLALIFPAALLKSVKKWWVVLVCIGYGGLIECLQPLTGRFAEPMDLLANTIGIIIGMMAGGLIRKGLDRD